MTYTVFRRSATSFEQLARANKKIIRTGLSLEEARALCKEFNDGRSWAQERAGTKLEFTADSCI
jgi:hypothetical protein